jgi:hypothetical protein
VIALLVAAAVAREPTFTVDTSALVPNVGLWAVRTSGVDCSGPAGDAIVDGRPARTLAVAAEIYSRKGGLSSWGHASVRFLFCQDGALRDVEYEAYAFDRKTGSMLADYWPNDDVLADGDYLRGERGSRILYRNDDPVDGGSFAGSAWYNREIYELWLDVGDADAALTALDATWIDERARMDARQPLAEHYRALAANCTGPLALVAPSVKTSPFPMVWRRRLLASGLVRARVLYPSDWALRHLERRGASTEVTALHPVFRWNRRLPPSTASPTTPAAVARLLPPGGAG